MNRTTTRRRWTALLLVAVAACGTGPGQRGMTVRDSAGVAVVEHGPELPSDVEHWSFEPRPTLDIGTSEGDEAYLFTRITQASVLPRGELLVADMGSSDLRIFDSTGRLVRRFGREGSGPGEFRDLSWVGVQRSGSIATYDRALRRFSRFSDDGTLEQVITPSTAWSTAGAVVGQLEDRSIVMRHLVSPPDRAEQSTGLVRDSIELFLIASGGSQRTPIGRFPGHENIRAVGAGIIAMNPAPFGLRTVMAVADTYFFVSTQEAYEIRTYRKDGLLQRVLRRRVPLQPVGASAKAEWLQQWAKRFAGFKESVPPPVMEIAKYRTLPEVFPAHGELLVDRRGNLWVEDYRPFPDTDTLSTWIVFSPNGAILATAELPAAQITEIGADRVVGVWRDSNDVPHVRVYRLRIRSRAAAGQD